MTSTKPISRVVLHYVYNLNKFGMSVAKDTKVVDGVEYNKYIEDLMGVTSMISRLGSENCQFSYFVSGPYNFSQLVVQDGIPKLAVSGLLSELKFTVQAECVSGILTVSIVNDVHHDINTVTTRVDIEIPVPEDFTGPVDNLVLECGQPHQASEASHMCLRMYQESELVACRESIEHLFGIKPNSDATGRTFLKVEFSIGGKNCRVLVVGYELNDVFYTWGMIFVDDFLCQVIDHTDA